MKWMEWMEMKEEDEMKKEINIIGMDMDLNKQTNGQWKKGEWNGNGMDQMNE